MDTKPPMTPVNQSTTSQPRQSSRIGITWVALAAFTVVLLLLAIFILQNSQKVKISFFGAHGNLSFGVAMLLSAITGVVLTLLIGSARIIQLRVVNRRQQSSS